jgi:hypothetical protein
MNEWIDMTNGTSALAGCHVDGVRGQYSVDHAVLVADEMLDSEASASLVSDVAKLRAELATEPGYVRECEIWQELYDLASEVVDLLNEVVPDGYSWSWDDGDLMLGRYDD